MGLGLLAGLGYAQPSVLYKTETREDVVAGMVAGGMARKENGKLLPLDSDGEFSIGTAEHYAEISAPWRVAFGLGSPSANPGVMNDLEVKVFWSIHITPEHDAGDLYVVRAWIADDFIPGRLLAVGANRLGVLKGKKESVQLGHFTVPRGARHGRLVAWVFQAGKPVAPVAGSAPERELALALMLADSARMDDALARGAKLENMPAWLRLHAVSVGKGPIYNAVQASPGFAALVEDGRTPFHAAADMNRAELVPELARLGVKLEAKDQLNHTALQRALYLRQADVALALLKAGAKPQSAGVLEPSSLSLAFASERVDLVQGLRAAGARWPTGDDLRYQLNEAAYRGNLVMVRFILASCKDERERASLVRGGGRPILGSAVVGRNFEVLKACLAAGADVNQSNGAGQTALMTAAVSGQDVMVAELLKAGAKAGQTKKNGHSALSLALARGDLKSANLLLAAPGPRPSLDPVGTELWESAAIVRDPAQAKLLRELHVPLKTNDRIGDGAVLRALANHFSEFYPVLAENGWNAETPWNKHWRLRDVAAWYGCNDLLAHWPPAPAGVKSGPPLTKAAAPSVEFYVPPQYPQGLKDQKITGEAEIEFYLSPSGEVVLPRVAKATHPEFGEAALRAVSVWRFKAGDSRVEWRHLVLPVGFTDPAEEVLDFVDIRELDEVPVPETVTAATRPADWPAEQKALAFISFDVGTDGTTSGCSVDAITDERWRQTLLSTMARWHFRPGIKLGRKVATRYAVFYWLPSGAFSTKEGVAETAPETAEYEYPFLIERALPETPRGWSKGLGLCGVKLTIDVKGRTRDIKVVASSSPELGDSAVAAIKRWRFTPAKIEGSPVPLTVLVPILFSGPAPVRVQTVSIMPIEARVADARVRERGENSELK